MIKIFNSTTANALLNKGFDFNAIENADSRSEIIKGLRLLFDYINDEDNPDIDVDNSEVMRLINRAYMLGYRVVSYTTDFNPCEINDDYLQCVFFDDDDNMCFGLFNHETRDYAGIIIDAAD